MRGNGYKLILGRFQLDTRGKIFMMKTAIGITSLGKWWIHQLWTLLRFCWMGCWAILSRCFCQESLDQGIVEVPSNAVFCDSVIL